MAVVSFRLQIGPRSLVLPEGALEIGRRPECWICLEDDRVSRVHARLHVQAESVDLEDAGSSNGTYVDGARVSGRVPLRVGSEIKIGDQLLRLTHVGSQALDEARAGTMRRTLSGEDAVRPDPLLAQLAEKSLRARNFKNAERLVLALLGQLHAEDLTPEDAKAASGIQCLIDLAQNTDDGSWIDRLFGLYAEKRWVLAPSTLASVRAALDRIPRIPGSGVCDYERALKAMARDGIAVPPGLTESVGELADAYANR